MRTLLLFRHAKSSWDDPSLDDHDRPLSPRGLRDAPRMGRFIAQLGCHPDLVLCSTAVRTRETLRLALGPLLEATVPEISFDRDLYEVPARHIRGIVSATPDSVATMMVIGHNPGMQDLALELTGNGEPEDRRRLAAKYPTAALALITFPVSSWRNIGPGAGNLVTFMTPKLLA